MRGRQIAAADFERFDLLIAMDDKNVAALRQICPPEQRDKIRLLMEFVPERTAAGAAPAKSPIRISAARKVSSRCWISAKPPAAG